MRLRAIQFSKRTTQKFNQKEERRKEKKKQKNGQLIFDLEITSLGFPNMFISHSSHHEKTSIM
jgi:hypothetical protein